MATTSSTTKSPLHKNSKKNGYSLSELQDKRLTSRHIAALMKLDDTLLENEQLKTKVDILEKETGSCLGLHEFARNSKQILENTENQYQKKIEQLVLTYDTKIFDMQREHESLQTENLKMSNKNQELTKQIVDFKENLLNYNVKQRDFENAEVIIRNLENAASQLNNELTHYKKKLEVSVQNTKEFQEESIQLKESLYLLQSKNNALCEENTKLRKLFKFEEENKSSFEATGKTEYEEEEKEEEKCKDSGQVLQEDSEKDKQISDLNRKVTLYELERQAIIQSSSDMEIEIQHLKKKLSTLNMSESVTKLKNIGSTPVSKRPESSVLRYSQE